MKLWAISDLHLRDALNRRALAELPAYPDDWVILAGDVGETDDHLQLALEAFTARFAKVLWIPGNHELWTLPRQDRALRGDARYQHLVSLCREEGVLTPEDPFPRWPGEGGELYLAPLFLLYDYSFRPDDVPEERALAWALEKEVLCTDEVLLHPDPYPSRQAWCQARCAAAQARLDALPATAATVLINHFPLRQDLAVLPAIPRFSLWCGTRLTTDWHQRYRARVVVSGHLHLRSTRARDGVRFEEVSLGHPGQWDPDRGMAPYLREILPA